MKKDTVPIPDQWPPEVAEEYEPIETLGKGGYASVMLARRKKQVNDASKDSNDEYVAMKIVGSRKVTRMETGYAHREIEILREVHHPNIVRLIKYWEPPPKSHICAAVMAMSYVQGPTLYTLIQNGGRLSLAFARVVAAQLVDAVMFLHYRAVVHRDIKPDNLMITGAAIHQDEIWDDDKNENDPQWKILLEKWHVTLIDFGFARALTPEDCKMRSLAHTGSSLSQSSFDSSMGHSSSRRKSRSLSISRKFHRQMSGVGNRAYAAPEIQKVRKNSHVKLKPHSTHQSVDLNETYAEYVASYGLMADAYSVGNTIKHMMTGARPDLDVNELIALENSPVAIICNLLCRSKIVGSDIEKDGGRRVKYRGPAQIPGEVLRLVRGLTDPDPSTRTTVRTARMYPWIDDVLERECPGLQEIDYLSFVTEEICKPHKEKMVRDKFEEDVPSQCDSVSPQAAVELSVLPISEALAEHGALPSQADSSVKFKGLMTPTVEVVSAA